MSNPVMPDETPKEAVVNKVVAPKRRYFVPTYRLSVKAANADEAVTKAKKLSKQNKEGR